MLFSLPPFETLLFSCGCQQVGIMAEHDCFVFILLHGPRGSKTLCLLSYFLSSLPGTVVTLRIDCLIYHILFFRPFCLLFRMDWHALSIVTHLSFIIPFPIWYPPRPRISKLLSFSVFCLNSLNIFPLPPVWLLYSGPPLYKFQLPPQPRTFDPCSKRGNHLQEGRLDKLEGTILFALCLFFLTRITFCIAWCSMPENGFSSYLQSFQRQDLIM